MIVDKLLEHITTYCLLSFERHVSPVSTLCASQAKCTIRVMQMKSGSLTSDPEMDKAPYSISNFKRYILGSEYRRCMFAGDLCS